jgi:LytS/YehU family sensor histidine kinase
MDVDPAVLDVPVPALVLQPLVENAIRYTVGARGDGHVTLRARGDGREMRLTVVDDGVGLDGSGAHAGTGTGLTNVRARLQHLYGDAFSLTLAEHEAGGVEAVVVIPQERSALLSGSIARRL